MGTEFLVNTVTEGLQSEPSVAALSDDRLVFSWSDASGIGGDTSSLGIKGQIFALTPPDTTSPTFLSGAVNGSTLVLTYNEALASADLPVASAFSVRVGGQVATVGSVAASGSPSR